MYCLYFHEKSDWCKVRRIRFTKISLPSEMKHNGGSVLLPFRALDRSKRTLFRFSSLLLNMTISSKNKSLFTVNLLFLPNLESVLRYGTGSCYKDPWPRTGSRHILSGTGMFFPHLKSCFFLSRIPDFFG